MPMVNLSRRALQIRIGPILNPGLSRWLTVTAQAMRFMASSTTDLPFKIPVASALGAGMCLRIKTGWQQRSLLDWTPQRQKKRGHEERTLPLQVDSRPIQTSGHPWAPIHLDSQPCRQDEECQTVMFKVSAIQLGSGHPPWIRKAANGAVHSYPATTESTGSLPLAGRVIRCVA